MIHYQGFIDAGILGDGCQFWGDKINNESKIIFIKDYKDWMTKRYKYMEFHKMLEIAEKYLLLM